MSTPLDQMLQGLIQQDLDRRSAEKRNAMQEISAKKRTVLDPNFSFYDPDRFQAVDADTVFDLERQELVRLTGGQGRTADAFETDINRYKRNPRRAEAHRQAYAALYGRDIEDVSDEDLVNAGKAQAADMANRLESLRGTGMGFRITGRDEYGRLTGQFDDNSVLDPIMGTQGNAGFFSQFNYEGLRDKTREIRQTGVNDLARPDRSLLRTGADQAVNVLYGTQKAISGLAQGFLNPFVNAATGRKGSQTVDDFFKYFNRGAEGTKELLASEGQKAREKFDQKESAMLRPLFEVRMGEYLRDNPGAPGWRAKLSAIMDETADRIEYLIEEPGRILDASFESLPYMIGVGAVGRSTAMSKSQQLRGQFLKDVKANPNLRRGAGTANAGQFGSTDAALARYMASDKVSKLIRKTARNSGIATVAVTEGFTNATEVYNSVLEMSEEEARQSEKYNALRDRGLSHEEATRHLAQKAFSDTLVMTMIVAGAASYISGAAGFESRLFTRLADKPKGAVSSNNMLARIAQTTGRGVGSFTGPGSREAGEEAVQSGGGEFISQLARFEATGVGEIGPGVGTALGEGALVGFASGAVAGGAGTAARGTLWVGAQVAEGFRKAGGTQLDEVKLRTPLTDENGNVGGRAVDARAQATKDRAEGRTTLETLNDALQPLDGKDATNAVPLINLIQLYLGDVEMDETVSAADKSDARNRVQLALDLAGAEARAQAEAILEEFTIEEIAADKEKLQILFMAKKYGGLTVEQANERVNRVFKAEDVVGEELQNAKDTFKATSGSSETGKPKAQVVQEKMGNGHGPTGPGLGAYVIAMQDAARNGDAATYAREDANLRRFIFTQENKVNAMREMAQRILVQGEAIGTVVREVNEKYGTSLFWQQPNAKAQAYNRRHGLKGDKARLTGSLQLGKEMADELQAMVRVRKVLADQAEAWNEGNADFKQTMDTQRQESVPANQAKPFQLEGVNAPISDRGPDLAQLGQRQQAPAPDAEPDTTGAVTDPNRAMSRNQLRELSVDELRLRADNLEAAISVSNDSSIETYTLRLDAVNQILDDVQTPEQSDEGPSAEGGGTSSTTVSRSETGTAAEPQTPASEGLPASNEARPESTRDRPAKERGAEVVNLDPDAPFQLNEGQQNAFEKALAFLADTTMKTFSIIGSAGTGKTTIVNEIITEARRQNPRRQIVLSSPTHRANSVIRSKTPNTQVETLHRVLGLTAWVDLNDYDASNPKFQQTGEAEILMPVDGVLIIDESSMINDDLYALVQSTAAEYGTKVIFIGDNAQLQPVKQNKKSKALFGTDDQAQLTQVMRAKNSALLDESVHVRRHGEFSNEQDMDNDQNGVDFSNDYFHWLNRAVDYFKSKEFAENPFLLRVVAFRNLAVSQLNKQIRKRVYGKNAPHVMKGEVFMSYDSWGDDQIKNSLDYRVVEIIDEYERDIFGVRVPIFELLMEDLTTGTQSVVKMVDPGMDEALQKKVKDGGRALRKAAIKAKNERYDTSVWKQFFRTINTYALTFDIFVDPSQDKGKKVAKKVFDYGFAHTIHKSQGGTYKYIFVAGKDIDNAKDLDAREQLRYVGVTRAEKGAFVYVGNQKIYNGPEDQATTPQEDQQADASAPVPETVLDTKEDQEEARTPFTLNLDGTPDDVGPDLAQIADQANQSDQTDQAPQRGAIQFIRRYTRELIQKTPDKIFVFGDNLARRGLGGQAKEARGEPNTVGVPTKYTPTRDEAAYFGQDIESERAAIAEAFDELERLQAEGKDIVFPLDGLGTGLAQLSERAPELAEYIDQRIEQLRNGGRDTRPWPDAAAETTDAGSQRTSEASEAATEAEGVEGSAPLTFDEEHSSVGPTLGELATVDAQDEAAVVPDLQEAPESPVEAAEGETQAKAPKKKELTPEQLEVAQRDVYELQRLSADGDSFTQPGQVRLSSDFLTQKIRELMDQEDDNGNKIHTASSAAEVYLQKYEEQLPREVFEAPTVPESSQEVKELTDTAETLVNGGQVESNILTALEPAVDLLSNTAVRLLGLWVGEKSNPLKWSDEKLAEVKELLKARLKRAGLPQSIRKALRLRAKKTSNMLAAIPNAFVTLHNTLARRAFINRIKANAREEQGFNGVVDFVNEFVKTLQSGELPLMLGSESAAGHKNSPFGNKKVGEKGIANYNRLHQYALQFLLDKDTGKLTEDLASILAIEAGHWLATSGASTLNNHEDVINQLIGNPEGTKISKEALKAFGNGTLVSNVVVDIGQRVLSQANLSFDGKGIDPLFLDELHSTIGTLALATLQQMELVKINPVEARVKRLFQETEDEALGDSNETLNLVHVVPAGETGVSRFEESPRNADLRNAFNSSSRILGNIFSSTSYLRGPLLEVPDAPSDVSRANTKVPLAQKSNMGKASKFAWRPIKSAVSLLDRFGSDERFAELWMESKDPAGVQVNLRDGQDSKNAANLRSIKHVREWTSANGFRKGFHFAYKMIRSGRIYIDSNTVNPQQDKLHRFLFGMNDWGVSMSTKSSNPRGRKYENFLIAVALGLDIDTSTLRREEVLSQVKAKLAEKGVQDAVDLLKQDRQYTDSEIAIIDAAIPSKERVHALVALQAWADYQKAQETPGVNSITIHLPMETDGKTNGFAARLLQTPPRNAAELEMVKNLLRATGIYFDGDEFNNYPQWAQTEGTEDNYESTATGTNSYAEGIINEGNAPLLNEPPPQDKQKYINAIHKSNGARRLIAQGMFMIIDRNFAKNPLMIVAYGAGYASIRRAIVKNAMEKFYEEMGKVQTPAELADLMVRLTKVADGSNFNLKRDYAKLRENWMKQYSTNEAARKFALEYEMSDSLANGFRSGHDAIYGHALQAALEDKLGPIKAIRDRLNQANYLMNLIFTRNFRRAIAQQARIKGRPLSALERKRVLQKMIKQGLVPLIKTPLSKSQLDSIETTSYGTILIGNRADYGTPLIDGQKVERKGRVYFSRPTTVTNTHFGVNDKGQLTFTPGQPQDSMVASMRGIDPNLDVGVAALVKMIHSSDGAVNGRIMGEYEILNVHDAQIGNFDKIDRIAQEANKTFYKTHKGWNLGQEVFDSLYRMLPLLESTDPRLSAAEKKEIREEFLKHLQERAGVSEEVGLERAQEVLDRWFKVMRRDVNETNEARQILFDQIMSVNQFAKEGSSEQDVEYTVPVNDQGAKNPSRRAVLSAAETVSDVMAEIRQAEANAWEKKKLQVIDALMQPKADIQAILNEWMKPTGIGHAPAAEDMLDVLFAAFEAKFPGTHVDNLRDMISLLRPMLSHKDENGEIQRVYVRLGSKELLEGSEAQYDADTNLIHVNPEARDPVEAILHEITHAANIKQLEMLQREETDVFQELLTEAKGWFKEQLGTATEGFPAWKLAQKLKLYWEDSDYTREAREVRLVTEYIAYLNATQEVQEDGSRAFIFRKEMTQSTQALAKSLMSRSGNNVFYSSPQDTTRSLFDKIAPEQLNANSVLEIWERLKGLERSPVDPTMATLYDRLMREYIVPGLQAIDEVVIRIATDSKGNKNIGKWVEDGQDAGIWIQAAKTSANNSHLEQSLQEVSLHEMLHAIFEHALTYDESIQNEANRLFDKVQEMLTNQYGEGQEWRVFLSEDVSTWTDLDQRLAKQQYSHIFENGAKSLHEFMAYAMTNPAFNEVLSNISDEPRGAIMDGTILGTLANLLERAIAFIRGNIFGRDERTLADGVERLAGRIVKVNATNRARAQKAADEGWVKGKLDNFNDYALKKLAELTHKKLQSWAEQHSRSGEDLADVLADKGQVAKLIKAAEVATASTLDENALRGFRDAFESTLTGIKKDNPLYQLLNEVLPWADRNRSWIDVLRRSERLVDMLREQKFQHTRTALQSYFDPAVKLTRPMREAITRVLVETDVVALTQGDNPMTMGELLSLLKSPQAVNDMIVDLQKELQQKTPTPELFNLFNSQSEGLANFMISGNADRRGQGLNAKVIVKQFMIRKGARKSLSNEAELQQIIDRMTSLRAFQQINLRARQEVLDVMSHEMSRPVPVNGFTGVLGTHSTFKRVSKDKLFSGDETQMIKGYTSDITDPEVEIKAVEDTPGNREAMKQKGYRPVRTNALPRDSKDPGPRMVLYKRTRGISTFSKSIMSLTGQSKAGTGMFDSIFATAPENQNKRVTAAQAYNQIRSMEIGIKREVEAEMNGSTLQTEDVYVLPLYNQAGEMVDFRYVMSKANKREHLKKRDMFDEVLPRMMASIVDKTNTKVINRETVDLLKKEWIAARKNKTFEDGPINSEDTRFVMIGANVPSEEGREMWNLLPKDTQLYARQEFGADVMFVRDDVVNLVLGFRKIAWSRNKFLAPAAPVVDVVEKIWLEVMQWVRFRIAVLTPAVVFGNMMSNFALLLSQGIPPTYIIRESKKAIIAMRKYQRDIRKRNEMQITIEALKSQGKRSIPMEQKLIRLEHQIEKNAAAPLVEHGMFTSIVEEFGLDEDSTRRQITTKVLDKFGGITGADTVVKVGQEAFMVPGSETAAMALMATQYGDFVGRFVQYNWNTKVGKKMKQPTEEQREVLEDLQGRIALLASRLDTETIQSATLAGRVPIAEQIMRLEQEYHRVLNSAPTVRVRMSERDAVHEALSAFIYYNIPQNRILQFLNDNGFMMFTKFFFRIQHVFLRTFKRNPTQALMTLGLQNMAGELTGSRTVEENIAMYAFLQNLTRKFKITPWEHVTNGELFVPTILKWIPETFYGA